VEGTHVSDLKTKPTKASVSGFLKTVDPFKAAKARFAKA
jgi:hypothetical protein